MSTFAETHPQVVQTTGVGVSPLFILFVLQCIALTHSDTEVYYAACGHSLRDLMVSSVCVTFVGLIGVVIISLLVLLCSDKMALVVGIILMVLYAIAEVVLSGLILNESVIALDNPNCTSAMQSTDGGIKSISANTGSPLLAIIGITSSALTFFALLCGFMYAVSYCLKLAYG